eukprot:m.52439 g.52439  ORF g.52439 m.52439 type:complete len:811 (+) comp16534_c0_seq1:273-2705(+)
MGCCGSKPQDEDTLGKGRTQPNAAQKARQINRTNSASLAIPNFEARTYDCKYQGRVAVSAPFEGDAQVAAAQKRMKKESSIKPQVAKLYVSGEHFRVSSTGAKDDTLYDCLISEVKFVSLNPKDKKGIAVISEDKHQIGFCHFFSIETASADDVRQAIGSAFRAAAELTRRDKNDMSKEGNAYARRMSKVMPDAANGAAPNGDVAQAETPTKRNAVQAGKDASEVMGTFEMVYLGSSPVKHKNGRTVAVAAVEALAATLRKGSSPKVAVIVSGEGIKAIDITTSEQELALNLRSLGAYFAITSSEEGPLVKKVGKKVKNTGGLVALFVNDDRLKRTTVAAFSCRSPAVGRDVCVALKKAFQVQDEIKKLRQKNPFAAISSTREACPSILFALQIHRSDLAAIKVIGYGQFGEVYLAKHATNDAGTTKVVRRAVKILKNSAAAADRVEFLKEAESMISLSHPNIVQLVGVAVQQRPWLTVLEFIEYGDLLAVSKTCKEKQYKVAQKEFYLWFVQIAAAMEYIASKVMIHMDLAARNVLLGEENLCKIADFGLTRKLNPEKGYYRLMKTMKLPVKWMAIESMADKVFSIKTDVWAYGITVWEVLSYGAIPYGRVKNMDVQSLVSKGLRATRPEGCHDGFYKFLLAMWDKNPKARPTFTVIKQTIQGYFENEAGEVRDVGETLQATEQPTEQPKVQEMAEGETKKQNGDNDAAASSSSDEVDSDSDNGDTPAATPIVSPTASPMPSDPVTSSDDDEEEEEQNEEQSSPSATPMQTNPAFVPLNSAAVPSVPDAAVAAAVADDSEEDSDSDLDC